MLKKTRLMAVILVVAMVMQLFSPAVAASTDESADTIQEQNTENVTSDEEVVVTPEPEVTVTPEPDSIEEVEPEVTVTPEPDTIVPVEEGEQIIVDQPESEEIVEDNVEVLSEEVPLSITYENLDWLKGKLGESSFTTTGDGKTSITIQTPLQMYYLSYVDPQSYQDYTITVTVSGGNLDLTSIDSNDPTYSFQGLGSEDFPFQGILRSGNDASLVFTLAHTFFNGLSSKASLSLGGANTLNFTWNGSEGNSVFANLYINSENESPTWTFSVGNTKIVDNTPQACAFSSIIGKMNSDSQLILNVNASTILNQTLPSVESKSGLAALICGDMGQNSFLNITGTTLPTAYAVSASTYAGGLVGWMEEGASLIGGSISGFSDVKVTSTNLDAGGLVGKAGDNATISMNSIDVQNLFVTASNGVAGGLVGSAQNIKLNLFDAENPTVSVQNNNISGKTAGGLIGSYTFGDVEGVWNSIDGRYTVKDNQIGNFSINNLGVVTAYDGTAAGGLFGVLNNISENQTFGINVESGSNTLTISKGTLGGFIGSYSANGLTSTLSLSGNVESTLSAGATNYGGAVGNISGNAYVNVNSLSVTLGTSDTNVNYLGGIAANVGSITSANEQTVLYVDGSTTITITKFNASSGARGGIVGQINEWDVLRLGGTTSIVGSVGTGGATGQIAGKQNSSLIYADGSGSDEMTWLFNRPTAEGNSDIGNYGEVLRVDSLIQMDDTSHAVTLNPQSCYESNTFSLLTPTEFAALAITLQTKGIFNAFGTLSEADILSSTVYLTSDISMAGTGVQSLTRDDGGNESFSGTFGCAEGRQFVLTLDVGEPYGMRDSIPCTSGTGTGRIYSYSSSHSYLGLFAEAVNATIQNVIFKGKMEFSAIQGDNHAGAAIARGRSGGITFNNVQVTPNEAKNNMDFTSAANVNTYVGGLLGKVNADVTQLTIGTCVLDAEINNNANVDSVCVGGAVGYLYPANGRTVNVNDTSLTGRISVNGGTNSKIGGLIGKIGESSDQSNKKTTVNLNAIEIGQSISTSASSSTGGLLGYEWYNTDVNFIGVTIKDSTLNSTGKANFGGLVYRATGHWTLENNGLTFSESNGFTGNSTTTTNVDGLLVCRGDGASNNNFALYLEVKNNGYNIAQNSVTVTKVANTYFDELVGVTSIKESASTPTPNYENNDAGIVSINNGLGEKLYDATDNYVTYANKASYTKVLKKGNPFTRYYYNLDTIGYQELSDGNVDTSQKLMAWSLRQYAENNLKDYFASSSTSYTIYGTLDMSGYSYYPVDNSNAQMGNDSTPTSLKFDNKTIEDKEMANFSTYATDTWTATQHFGMQAGLFRNVSISLTVKNIILEGNVGQWFAGSGALICSTFIGGYLNGTTPVTINLTLNNVQLKGVNVNQYSDGNNALLVQNACTSDTRGYSNINLTTIYTIDGYNENQIAAGSLIGDIGNTNARQIKINFSDMRLDGRNADSTTSIDAYRTTRSIFKNATFLNSFRYASECSGTYNFNQAEDWANASRHIQQVTYGKEIISSLKNLNEQQQYIDQDIYVDPATYNASSAYDGFSIQYLPYVYQTKVQNSGLDVTYYEIDVNVKAVDMIDGCGTYGDPYQITSYNQLKIVANYLAGTNRDGWRISYNANKTFCNESRENSTDSNHQEYQYTAGSTTPWSCIEAGSTAAAVSDAIMKDYLRNAYYEIVGNESSQIIMQSGFIGMGTDDYPFMGVIVGATQEVKLIYENEVDVLSRSGLGQLINVSYGSVVKNLKIQYNDQITISQTAEITSTTNVYFGSVIGHIKGGDNVIDNVQVNFSDDSWTQGLLSVFDLASTPISLTGSNVYASTVGGYVGLIEAGGVIFKNMNDSDGLSTLGSDTYTNYYYANPFVGRVLDAFVIYEKGTGTADSLSNTDKNYTIHTMTGDTSDLTVTGTPGTSTYIGEVTVKDAEGLFVLSAIVNSGAGAHSGSINTSSSSSYGKYDDNYTNDNNYQAGKVRCSNYDTVGQVQNFNEDDGYKTAVASDDVLVNKVNAIGQKISYLVKNYTNSGTNTTKLACTLTGSYTRFTITLTGESDFDLSPYGNGFRGIGGRYIDNERRQMNINSFSGNDAKITLAIIDNEYAHFSDTNDSKEVYKSWGAGLFTTLGKSINVSEIPIKDFTISGSAQIILHRNITSEEYVSAAYSNEKAGVGGFLGRYPTNSNTILFKFENVKIESFTASGTNYAGGLIGYIVKNITMIDCDYDTVNVDARYSAGGLVGFCDTSSNLTIETNLENSTLKNATVTRNINKKGTSYGAGGIVGACMGKLNINVNEEKSSTPKVITLSNMKITCAINITENGENITAAGGIVGGLKDSEIYYVDIVDSTIISSRNSTSGYDLGLTSITNYSAGGALGNAAGAASINYVNVYATSGNSFNIFSGANGGALVGRHSAGSLTVDNCKVNLSNDSSKSYGTLNIFAVSRVGGAVGYDGVNEKNAEISVTNSTIGSENATTNFIAIVGQGDPTDAHCGGLIGGTNTGYDGTRTTKIGDCVVQNVNILANDFAGGVVGQAIEKYNISNTTVQDCNIMTCNRGKTTANSKMAGGLIGDLNKNEFQGSNILIKNNLIGYYIATNSQPTIPLDENVNFNENTIAVCENKTTFRSYNYLKNNTTSFTRYDYTGVGTWVGKNTSNKAIKLVGVSRQGEFIPPQEVGNATASNYNANGSYNGINTAPSYIVYADYMAYQDNTAASSPYITSNPLNQITSGLTVYDQTVENPVTLYGDGTAFVKSADNTVSTTPIAQKIYTDYTNMNGSKITNAYVAADVFSKYSNSVSDYNANQSQKIDGNFPVLVISTLGNATGDIQAYLNLLSNGAFDTAVAAGVVTSDSIQVKTYSYQTNKFVEIEDSENKSTIYYYSAEKQFIIRSGQYDNDKSQFTLVSVKISDDYTIYAPVMVQRIVNVQYTATLSNGPVFQTTTRDSAIVAEYGETITTYLTYEYDFDWTGYLEQGNALTTGYEKTVQTNVDGQTALPVGTVLTLVDVQQNNKAYYWTMPAETTLNVKFTDFKDSNGNAWKPEAITEVMGAEMVSYTGSGVGWCDVASSDGTLKIGENWYRPAGTGDTNQYSLNLKTDSENLPMEKYYLVIETPVEPEGEIWTGTNLALESTLNGPLPNKPQISYTNLIYNTHENQASIYSNLSQNVGINSSSNTYEQLDFSNASITVVLKDTIQAQEGYTEYLNDARWLRFLLSVKDKDNLQLDFQPVITGTVSYKIYTGNSDSTEEIDYNSLGINSDNLKNISIVLDQQSEQIPLLLPQDLQPILKEVKTDPFTVEATVKLDFPDETAMSVFPQCEEPIDGNAPTGWTKFWAIGQIATNQERIASGTKSTQVADKPGYYRVVKNEPHLDYNSIDQLSQLGINVSDLPQGSDGYNDIKTLGIYSLLNVDNRDTIIETARTNGLKCTLQLIRKNADGNYNDVTPISNLEDYITVTDIAPSDGKVQAWTKEEGCYTAILTGDVFDAAYSKEENQFSLPFTVRVKTDIESLQKGTYANYELKLTVEMVNQTDIPSCSDYFKYTLARVSTSILRPSSDN